MENTPVWHESVEKKKKKKKNPIIVIIVAVILIFGLAQLEIYMAYQFVFGRRFLTTDDLGIMTYEDFTDLSVTEDFFLSNNDQVLRGGFFSNKKFSEYKGIVVLSHGFGSGGYAWYLPQVSYLADHGYLVYTFDKTGADSSDGVDVRGLPQGIIDLQYALNHIKTMPQAEGLPLLLYGHSWGGYSSLSILQDEKDVTAVASLSGFNTSQDMIIFQGKQMFGDYIEYLSPFLKICDKIRFGKYADYSSLKGLSETKAKVILFHSDDDSTIPIDNSFNLYKDKLSSRENITFVPLSGKKHDVYFSDNATKYRVQSRATLKGIRNEVPEYSIDNEYLFYLEFDRAQANAVDPVVMGQVVEFFDQAVLEWEAQGSALDQP